MASLEDVGELVRRAAELIERARDALWTAADRAEEARDLLLEHGAGSADPEWEQAAANFDSAARGSDELRATAASGALSAASILAFLELRVPSGTDSATTTARPRPRLPEAVPPGSPEHVDRLRRDLPPRVQSRAGQKTHGRWFSSTAPGKVGAIVSGEDGWADEAVAQLDRLGLRTVPVAATDVETKLAAHMAKEGITSATVVINHRPCKGEYGCDSLVPILLPEGSSLTVHGITRQGTIMRTTYTGGARPTWI